MTIYICTKQYYLQPTAGLCKIATKTMEKIYIKQIGKPIHTYEKNYNPS